MSTVTAFRSGLLEAWWAAPLVFAFAFGLATAFPLDPLRVRIGRWSATAGYLVGCVPCLAGELAIGPAVLVGLEARSWWAGVAAWAGAWTGALFLDAALDRLRSAGDRPSRETTPTDWQETCLTCDASLAGLPESGVAVIVTGARRNLRFAHRRCPYAERPVGPR